MGVPVAMSVAVFSVPVLLATRDGAASSSSTRARPIRAWTTKRAFRFSTDRRSTSACRRPPSSLSTRSTTQTAATIKSQRTTSVFLLPLDQVLINLFFWRGGEEIIFFFLSPRQP